MPEGTADRDAAAALHARLAASSGDYKAERVVFDAYTTRCRRSLDEQAPDARTHDAEFDNQAP